jgi:hypothetical protein
VEVAVVMADIPVVAAEAAAAMMIIALVDANAAANGVETISRVV